MSEVLIRYFSVPYSFEDGVPQFHTPADAPEKWAVFKAYNKRDVETEMGIEAKISRFPVPDFVWDEYHLDQEINDRGISIDLLMVQNAIRIGDTTKESLTAKLSDLTGIENPNSVVQMKEWFAQTVKKWNHSAESAGTARIRPPELQEVLRLRREHRNHP